MQCDPQGEMSQQLCDFHSGELCLPVHCHLLRICCQVLIRPLGPGAWEMLDLRAEAIAGKWNSGKGGE